MSDLEPRSTPSAARRLQTWLGSKQAKSLLLALFLGIITVDAMPGFHKLVRGAKRVVDPLVDAAGLWQGGWELFAPDVDKINTRISAEILFSDGSTVTWHSPDWTKLSPFDRFLRFREAEFYDAIRNDSNSGAWPALARYLARTTVPPAGATDSKGNPLEARHVALYRHWVVIENPLLHPMVPFGTYPPIDSKALIYHTRLES